MMTTNDLAMLGASRSTWSPNTITDDLQVYGGGRPNMALIKDELISIGGRVGKFSGSVKFEDDDLVDDLGFKKFMKKAGKSTVKVTKSAAKGTVKAVKSIAKSDVGKAAIKTGSKMAVDTAMASLTDELWCGPICKYKLKKAAKAAKLAAEASTVEIKDELVKVGGRIGKFSGSVSFEDDDDLVDDLGFKSFMKKTGKGISKAAKSTVKVTK